MHTRVQEVFSELDACRTQLNRAVTSIPASLRDARQISSQWSVAESLEHLILVEAPFERFVSQVWIPKVRAGALGLERKITVRLRQFLRWRSPMSLGTRSCPHLRTLQPA